MENEDDNKGLIDIIGEIAGLYDAIKTLEDFFNPPASLADMFALLLVDIDNIFIQEIANEDLKTATATLQNVQNFFSIDYADAINNNESNQQLYTLLTQDNAAPSLSNFDTIINLIVSWAQQFSTDPSQIRQNIASQSITFSLTSYLYLVLLYKERSRVYYTASTNPADRLAGINAEWANMQKYALNGIAIMQPIVTAIANFRFSQPTNTDGDYHFVGGGGWVDQKYITFTDDYLSTTIKIITEDSFSGMGSSGDNNYQNTDAINDFKNCYVNVLQNGTGNQGQWVTALNDSYNLPLVQNNIDFQNSSNINFAPLPPFGDFYVNSQKILSTLTTISTTVCPYS